jgi:hypothetical protein
MLRWQNFPSMSFLIMVERCLSVARLSVTCMSTLKRCPKRHIERETISIQLEQIMFVEQNKIWDQGDQTCLSKNRQKCSTTKFLSQFIIHAFYRGNTSSPQIRAAYLCIFQKNVQSKWSPKRRKLSESGHPCLGRSPLFANVLSLGFLSALTPHSRIFVSAWRQVSWARSQSYNFELQRQRCKNLQRRE